MATSFKVKFSKSKNQQTITIVRDDNVDLSTITSMEAKSYSSDLSTPDNTYEFTAQDITDLVAGTVDITTLNLLGSATPEDDYYTVILEADTASFVSDSAGIGITLEALYEALKHTGKIDVYSPDFRVDRVLLTSFMLAFEMDNLEIQDASKQKRADFISRQLTLQKILSYS